MPAASLTEAAGQSYDKLYTRFAQAIPTIKNSLFSFVSTCQPQFPQDQEAFDPLNNWFALIDDVATRMAAPPPIGARPSYEDFVASANYVYRMLWLTHALNAQTPKIVSNAQAAAVLAAYNATID